MKNWLQPTVFYREFFEKGAAAFQTKEHPRHQAEEKQKRIEFLERKVQTKDEVLAELMAEHIASEGVRVVGHVVGQELDRHEAAQVEVLCFVDHTHATTAGPFENAVVRDGLVNHD